MLGYAAVSATKNRRRQGSKGEELPSRTVNDKSLAIFKEMKSQAGMDLWNHPAQALHSAALERLK